ncbi:MAG: hypothetical protein AAFN11_05980, partial [Chloroflexota bacterium]
MAGFGFPILSALIWIPVIAGIIILFIPATMRDMYRGVAITAAFVILALSGMVFFGYNGLVIDQLNNAIDDGLVDADATEYDAFYIQNEEISAELEGVTDATVAFKESLVFEEYIEWVPEVGIAYNLGVDGLTAPMVLLTGLVSGA